MAQRPVEVVLEGVRRVRRQVSRVAHDLNPVGGADARVVDDGAYGLRAKSVAQEVLREVLATVAPARPVGLRAEPPPYARRDLSAVRAHKVSRELAHPARKLRWVIRREVLAAMVAQPAERGASLTKAQGTLSSTTITSRPLLKKRSRRECTRSKRVESEPFASRVTRSHHVFAGVVCCTSTHRGAVAALKLLTPPRKRTATCVSTNGTVYS
eukprot:6675672-Prymnesium_polylepis.1